MGEAFRLVIAGGGIAGLEVATRIGETLGRRGQARITLIDRGLSHVWKPMLHGFAAGTARPEREKVSFLAQARRRHFRFWPGTLAGVDRGLRQVTITPFADPAVPGQGATTTRTLDYDALVIAIGSRANDFGTRGVAEHCLFIDDLVEADAFHLRLRQHLLASLDQGETLTIAIVGGGATGVQLAAELKRALDLAAGYAPPGLRPSMRLWLLESGPRLLPAFPARVSDGARQTLEGLGVEVRTATQVTGADAAGYTLQDGSRIEARLKVWAAGVRAPAVTARIEGLERGRTGQLVVSPSLQTTRDDAIFALGDCASLTGAGGHPVPATAQAARQQARHLSRHLARWIGGRAMPPFRYREVGAVVSLADYNGWGTLGRFEFGGGLLHGLSARLAHALLYRQHQFELYGPWRGAATWLADDLDRLLSPKLRLD